MRLAIEQAQISLREGNKGFGAVIIKNDLVISIARDGECTGNDPTSHAELNAIRIAAQKLGKNLSGCILISTHEPCPMCASAIVWSGITEIAYGYSIKDAIAQGRRRINMPCSEIFQRAGVNVKIHEGVLKDECSVLYREDVRAEVKKLRGATDKTLSELNADSINRRIQWFKENKAAFDFLSGDAVTAGYKLLLKRFNITEAQAPVVAKSEHEVVFHSQNFCPTLEACRILGLDTRDICRKLNETATDLLVKQVNPRLEFSRNYQKLRPYTEYCEEKITYR
jgi:tRNA(Arg) A34 adenosine deaminase TadA